MNHLKIVIDGNTNYGAYYIFVTNGKEHRFEPFKSLNGLSEEDIAEYSVDHIEWITKLKVDTCDVEYADADE